MLPSSKQLKEKAASNEITVQLPDNNPTSTRFPLKDITDQVFNSINRQFQSITGVDFATAQAKSQNIGLTKILSKSEQQKKRRSKAKTIVNNIQNVQKETNVIR